jgi:hypothetical protein
MNVFFLFTAAWRGRQHWKESANSEFNVSTYVAKQMDYGKHNWSANPRHRFGDLCESC